MTGQETLVGNFEMAPEGEYISYDVDYDFGSIMHYHAWAVPRLPLLTQILISLFLHLQFTLDGNMTIVPKPAYANEFYLMGQRDRLSSKDKDMLTKALCRCHLLHNHCHLQPHPLP